MISTTTDPQGRYIILVFKMNNGIYTYSKHLCHKLWTITEIVNNLKQGCTFMCRDFNLATDASVDVKGLSTRKPCQMTLIPCLHADSLFDIWRYQHTMKGTSLSSQRPIAPTLELIYLWRTNKVSKMPLRQTFKP